MTKDQKMDRELQLKADRLAAEIMSYLKPDDAIPSWHYLRESILLLTGNQLYCGHVDPLTDMVEERLKRMAQGSHRVSN